MSIWQVRIQNYLFMGDFLIQTLYIKKIKFFKVHFIFTSDWLKTLLIYIFKKFFPFSFEVVFKSSGHCKFFSAS
jgi:hypothetical protein